MSTFQHQLVVATINSNYSLFCWCPLTYTVLPKLCSIIYRPPHCLQICNNLSSRTKHCNYCHCKTCPLPRQSYHTAHLAYSFVFQCWSSLVQHNRVFSFVIWRPCPCFGLSQLQSPQGISLGTIQKHRNINCAKYSKVQFILHFYKFSSIHIFYISVIAEWIWS